MTAERKSGIPIIDGHVHVNRFDLMRPAPRALIESNPGFADMRRFVASPQAFLTHLDHESIEQAWLVNYCAKEVMGYGWEVNDWIAEYVQEDPKRLVAVGGFDPRLDGDGESAAERLHDLGIRVVKIHPVHQHIAADDEGFHAFFARVSKLGMPVIFHTGTSRFPGADNAFSNPQPVGRVAAEHPDLQVIIAHGGRPNHTQAAVAILAHHPNTWLDLSSCPPRKLQEYFGDLETLAPRLLWGSDWPGPGVPGMRRNVDAFLGLGLSQNANRMILHDNAANLLD